MHKPIIYAKSVQHLTDARYFAAVGADYIGFYLETGNKEALSLAQFKEISGWLAGIELVAEVGSFTDAAEIQNWAQTVPFNTVQLPYIYNPIGENIQDKEIIKELVWQQHDPLAWLALKEDALAGSSLHRADAFYINLSALGDISQEQPFLQKLTEFNRSFKAFYQFDMPVASLQSLLNQLPLYGLAVMGGEEERVGIKSFDELNDLFDMLND